LRGRAIVLDQKNPHLKSPVRPKVWLSPDP
jgi:hypothetical protein